MSNLEVMYIFLLATASCFNVRKVDKIKCSVVLQATVTVLLVFFVLSLCSVLDWWFDV